MPCTRYCNPDDDVHGATSIAREPAMGHVLAMFTDHDGGFFRGMVVHQRDWTPDDEPLPLVVNDPMIGIDMYVGRARGVVIWWTFL